MATLSFKQFLSIVQEDATQDIAKLTSDIALIDTQINQRTQPLLARKNQLQKLLAIRQKQAQVDQKQAGTTPQQGEMQAGQQQPANQTVTPGSSRSATPGGAPSLQ